ncbi:unnamed protein product [Schistocephalus solidus]|uniref:Uncharacterized protein n=1 Tax=Schistocephalus solidus TaxID=70667 RepID=A0A3P7CUL8_SCHSO|nr:unnamed protein product [Schistocephalus solidus]
MEEKRRTVRSHHPLDPVSASRTPNASSEPPFKTRYATHSFASSGFLSPFPILRHCQLDSSLSRAFVFTLLLPSPPHCHILSCVFPFTDLLFTYLHTLALLTPA